MTGLNRRHEQEREQVREKRARRDSIPNRLEQNSSISQRAVTLHRMAAFCFARSRLFEFGRVLVRFDDVPAASSDSPSRRRTGIEVFRAAIE